MLYTPFHWLAFWNDHKSIDFLLNTLDVHCTGTFAKLMNMNESKLTALDLAGSHQAFESLFIMLHYFKTHFGILEKIFEVDKVSNQTKKNKIDARDDGSG